MNIRSWGKTTVAVGGGLGVCVPVLLAALAITAASVSSVSAQSATSDSTNGQPRGALPVVPLPQLHKLTGLSAGDHLNVRRQASAGSEDIGNVSPDMGPVDIIGIDDSGEWGRIVWQDANAWLSLNYLEPDDDGYLPGARVPEGLQCVGAEPFWSYTIKSAQEVALQYPDRDESPDMILDQVLGSSNRIDFPLALLAASASLSTTAMLRTGLCFDGMSDREYGWSVDILVYERDQQRLLSGCCHLPLP